jgi:hypothetical protein
MTTDGSGAEGTFGSGVHARGDRASTVTDLILLLAVACAGPAVGQGAPSAAPRLATVTVSTSRLGREIPRDFIGFSLEVSTAGQGIGAFAGGAAAGGAAPTEQAVYALGHPDAPNEGYFRLMRSLGAGILRLGGNSQDNSCWDRERAPHPEACEASLGADDLHLFAAAARASGWRLILGLNLKQNAPEWAVGEVTDGVAATIAPGDLFAVEFGNEPDLFARTPYRPQGYAPDDDAREFLSYLRALRADPAGRQYPLVGPGTCCGWRNARDLGVFIDGVGRDNLAWVAVHNYSATTCGGQTLSIGRLLSPELMDGFRREARPLIAAARARGLPIAMTETNSASCGGMPGVSNAFASALWGLDFAFTMAEDGFVYVGFHTSYRPGGGSSYNPIDTYAVRDASGGWRYRNIVEPLFYALYLFARNASGERVLPVSVEAGANVRAYAVSRCPDCAVRIFVLNKDLSAAGTVRVRVAGGVGDGTLLLLDAPALDSRAGEVRYGGRQFDTDGRIGAPETTTVHQGGPGNYDFTLPHAAIALLTVERRGR